MPLSPTLPFKDKDKINNSKLITTKIINGDSSNQRTIKFNKNKSAALNTSDKMDTTNNVNSSSGGWTTSTTNKTKRIHSNSSDPSSPRSPINKNKKLFFSTNRYEVLSQDDPPSAHPSNDNNDNNTVPIQNPTDTLNVTPKVLRPPPIFVRGVYNFPDLCTKLIELIGVDNFCCKSSTDRVKIMTTNPESYRALVHFLKDQKAEFHTFQLKEDKPLRVVIRNLHPTTPTELIKSELEMRLFEVRQVSKVLHKVNKHPLPLFFVDLEPTDQSNDIYNLTSLLHTLIKVEEPYKPKTLNQCSNCQDYGHTKSYCGYPARCVRCGAQHLTSDCPNSRDAPPKCALCSGDHPSNYKGCSIYRDLQRRKKPKSNNQVANNINPKNIHVQETQPVKASSTHPPTANYTYAQATSNSNANNTVPPPTDINLLLASFMNEFKQLISPLITLLTKVVSNLLDKK
uniref:Nucleic-acid-binding protein n=1 Tax=Schizaphis graminum TaxID=13262 RepID=A0A2S2PDP3_SCHGA